MSNTPRIELLEGRKVRVVAERVDAAGVVSQIVEDCESEPVKNRERNVRNIPPNDEGDSDMNRFDENADVPTLQPPTYQNKGQQDEEAETQQFCNVTNEDGSVDRVPALTPPSYDHGRMVARREQAVVNGDDSDSDVPVLTPPTYDTPKNKDRR